MSPRSIIRFLEMLHRNYFSPTKEDININVGVFKKQVHLKDIILFP